MHDRASSGMLSESPQFAQIEANFGLSVLAAENKVE
jgi:hypothetical protein